MDKIEDLLNNFCINGELNDAQVQHLKELIEEYARERYDDGYYDGQCNGRYERSSIMS
jgi:hypothetical protein